MTRDVHLESFSLALKAPLGTASGEIREREGFLVGVESETDDGVVRGLGEATPLPGWTESLADCEAALNTASEDSRDAHPSPCSDHPAASHGFQLASLDAEARVADVSLATLLADEVETGQPASTVPVNATIGDGTVEEAVAAAEATVEDGFHCLKLKVGAQSTGDDIQRIWAVDDAVDVDLRLDVNGAWDRETAGELVKLLGAVESLDYIEQPLPAEDLEGLADLRGFGVDIAVDESLREVGVRNVLDAEAADVAVLKPMTLGGPRTTAKIAARLRDEGVDPVVTTTIDGAVARAAAVHVAATIPDVRPCGLATGSLLAEDFGPDPVPVESGRIVVPDGPGNLDDRFDHLVWKG